MKKTLKSSLSAVIAVAMMICTLIGTISSNAVDSKLPGDVSKDGKTDNKDIVCLFRYLSGSLGDNDVDVTACDTTGDGKINNKDVTVLFRYLNGEDYEIFYGALPELDNVYRLWNDTTKKALAGTKQTRVTLGKTGICLTAAGISGAADPFATFDIAKYAELTGKPALSGKDGAYVVFRLRSNADGYIELFTHAPAVGDTSSAIYKTDNKFRYVIVDMTKTTFTEPEKLSTLRIDWTGGEAVNGMTMTISEIGFFADLDSALEYTKLTKADLEHEYEKTVTVPKEGDITGYVNVLSDDSNVTRSTDGLTNTAIVTSAKKNVRVAIDVRAMAEQSGKYVTKNDHVAVRFRVKGLSGASLSLQSVTDVSGLSASVSNQRPVIDCTTEDWQGVMFNIRDVALYENTIKKLSITINNFNSNGSIEIGGVVISDNINDALTLCNHEEYCLNYDSTLTDNDVLANSVLVAPYEDESVKLWFDQTTEKTYQNDTESTGRTGYTVRMAKNESENCQFFIAPEKTFSARIEVEEFKNSKGDTIQSELAYEYYHNINYNMIPDGLPDLTGPIEIKAGNSQGFIIRLTTLPETAAGLYESVIHVYDNDTGKEIKRAAVAAKVWNFELSDETELRTAFALWMSYVGESYPYNQWTDDELKQVADNYFSFFRKYRINIMDHPNGITSSKASAYMNDPRTNTARWQNFDLSVTEDVGGVAPAWKDKVIYYPGDLDEPKTNTAFANFKNYTDRIKKNTPDYRMVVTMDYNLNMNADGTIASSYESSAMDEIEYLKDYVNIWCPKLDAFTSRDLSFISRVSFLQSEQQDAKYGSFISRMKEEVAGGDELWTYVCVNPVEPYANWQLLSDGTETIVSIWQMKEYDITGMLYWAVSYWKVNYWGTAEPWTGSAYGDGILIYSGHTFRSLYPIPTLRLESIRDGIEDYQMLCMLEDALGEEAANEMISRITTSVVTYSNNDDYIHAVRVLLGDTLEAALAH